MKNFTKIYLTLSNEFNDVTDYESWLMLKAKIEKFVDVTQNNKINWLICELEKLNIKYYESVLLPNEIIKNDDYRDLVFNFNISTTIYRSFIKNEKWLTYKTTFRNLHFYDSVEYMNKIKKRVKL